jgi:TRAP-type mannitol/chloroaromatic compound transport system permease small subunit
MSALDRLLTGIDLLSEWSGKLVGFLLLPIVGVMVFEVASRYVFNAPTIWSTDVVVMLAGTLYIVGGAYTHYLGGHINVETLFDLLSPRWQSLTRILLHFPLFLLYVGVLLWVGWDFAWSSLVEGERAGTLWNPIIWPFKMMIPLGALLILLQGLAQLIRDVRFLVTGQDPSSGATEEIEPEL